MTFDGARLGLWELDVVPATVRESFSRTADASACSSGYIRTTLGPLS